MPGTQLCADVITAADDHMALDMMLGVDVKTDAACEVNSYDAVPRKSGGDHVNSFLEGTPLLRGTNLQLTRGRRPDLL